MAIFRKRRMVAPINSRKHFVSRPVALVAAAAIANIPIVTSVVASAVNLVNEVIEGSVVKAIWVEMWIISNAAANTSSFTITLEKVPAGATQMTVAQAVNLMVYPNKKNILYTTQGIVSANAAGAQVVPVLRQFFAIPKGKQRMGLGDEIILNIFATGGEALNTCGMFIYKEYY